MISIFFCLTLQTFAYLSLELGQTYNDAIIPWQGDTNYKYYQFDLQKVIKDRDLIIVVKQQSTFGNPDIYISSQEKPNKTYSEIQCNSQGMDICIIPNPELKTYYLAVYCEEYCRYNLKVVYQEELIMTNSDDLEFKFNSTSWTEIIRIKIDKLKQYSIQQDQHLEVQVQVKNLQILQESFVSYLNQGLEKPTPQNYDYKGQDTFSGIQKFKISRITANQTYTLLVEAQQGAIVQINTRTYGQTRFINVGESLEDVILENDIGFYVLNITSDQESFILGQLILNIQLISFKGYTEMYVNLDENPSSLEEYNWKLLDGATDDLIITNEDLNRQNSKGFYAYVAIQARESNATFQLKTQMLNPDLMVMELNKAAISKMSRFKYHQYKFFIKSNKKQSVSVNLKNIKGDADIILKKCSEFWTCKFSYEEYTQIINSTQSIDNTTYKYSLNAGNDIIIYDYLPQNCRSYENVHMCFYSIMIISGIKNLENELTYSILITSKEESIILKENTPVKQFVFHEFYNYYKFTVDDSDHIKRLFIQLTPIQGQPKIFSSQSEMYPTKEQNDNQGIQNVITYGGKQNGGPINSTIYIGVYGETASQYIITAIVFRKQEDWGTIGKYAHQYIQLIEGYPQEITTKYSSDVQLFKIDLNGYSEEDSVKVQLRINSGEFVIYGFDHPETDISQAFLNGSHSILLQSNQKHPQYLYVRVQVNQSSSYPFYSYSICYRVSSQPIELVLGDNYQGFIDKSDIQAYYVNIYKKADIYINLHAENIDQSILSAKIFVQEDTIQMNQQSMVITANKIEFDKCKKTEEIVACQIAIYVQSKEDTNFSLLISKQSQIIKLYNDESISKTITNRYDYFTFLLTEETEIVTFSFAANIRILVSIVQLDPPKQEQFPTNDDDSQIQSLNDQIHQESSVFIPLEQLQKQDCYRIPCYAAVTCTNADPLDKNNKEYTIVRSSGAIKLVQGFVYSGRIYQQKLKYFKVVDVQESIGLQVVATCSQKNQLNIYASANQMPTKFFHDYSNSLFYGDQLIIPQKQNSSYLVTYYIGIQAYNEVNVQIQVNFGQTGFYNIIFQKQYFHNIPQNSKTYFQVYNIDQQDFNILINTNTLSEYQKPKIYIKSYMQGGLSEAINSIRTQYHWQMKDYYLEITSDQENFCFNCFFLIYLENQFYDFEFSIQISRKGYLIQLLDNVEIKNQLKTNEFQKYVYIPQYQTDFYLNVTIYQGQIYLFDKVSNDDTEYSNLRLVLDTQDGLFDKFGKQIASREGIYASRSLLIDNVIQENNLSVYGLKVFSNFTDQSIYLIEIISKNQAIELKVGQTQKFRVDQKYQVQFYFVIPNGINYQNEDYFSITIESDSKLKDRIIYMPEFILKQDMNNNPDIESQNHDFADVSISVLQKLDRVTYIQIPSLAGLYFLTIIPKEFSYQVYNVILGNKEFDILTPKQQRLVRTKVGEQRIWEIQIMVPSKLFVQAQLCGGIVNGFGSMDRDELSMGYYKDKIESIENKQLFGTIESVLPNVYYLKTQTIKSTTQKEYVSYMLRLDVLEQNTIIPKNHFYPGNEGLIKLSVQSKYLVFDFSPIQISEKSSEDYELERITYTFFYQNQRYDDNQILDRCGDYQNYDSFTISRIEHDPLVQLNQRITFDGMYFEKVQATILATVQIKTNNHETLQLSYFYNTQIIDSNTQSDQTQIQNDKALYIIILTVLLFVFFMLALKYKNLRQIAKFEVTAQQPQYIQEQSIEMNYTNFR